MLNSPLAWRLTPHTASPHPQGAQRMPLGAPPATALNYAQNFGRQVVDYIMQNRLPGLGNLKRQFGTQPKVLKNFAESQCTRMSTGHFTPPCARQSPRPNHYFLESNRTPFPCTPRRDTKPITAPTETTTTQTPDTFDPKTLLELAKATQHKPSRTNAHVTGSIPTFESPLKTRSTQTETLDAKALEAHQKALDKIMVASGPTRFGLNTKVVATLNAYGPSHEALPNLISDHLPVAFNVTLGNDAKLHVISWNLLSQCHQNNSFLGISLSPALEKLSHAPTMQYFNNSSNSLSHSWLLYDLAAELDQSGFFDTPSDQNDFLLGTARGHELLENFLNNHYAFSENAALKQDATNRGTNPISTRREARQTIVDALCQSATVNSSASIDLDTYVTLVSAYKLHHAIHHKQGKLNWENRKQALEKNPALLHTLSKADMIVLQECTDPKHFLEHLNKRAGCDKFAAIIHKTKPDAGNTDHCCIMYDVTQWQPETTIRFGLNKNKKPAILAKFNGCPIPNNSKPRESIVVGSIHYPGGQYDGPALAEMATHLQALNHEEERSNTPFILAGDYNQQASDLSAKLARVLKNASVNAPTLGTMAGSDWEEVCRGKTIDMSITNRPCASEILPVHLLACPTEFGREGTFIHNT